jgi:Trypsin
LHPRHALTSPLVPLLALCTLVLMSLAATPAEAIVGGTDQVSDQFTAPLAYIEISQPRGTAACTGTLIAPNVIMTAAHCVYETNRHDNLIGIARPADFRIRVGSRDVSNAALGIAAEVTEVLPQPYYRWDGNRHFHDIALLALARPLPQTPVHLAEQHPGAGKPLLIAGYGRSSTSDRGGPRKLRVAQIDAADPASCHLVSESFDPSWLFCGTAATSDLVVPGGTACFGDSGGPAFASENTTGNVVIEGVISYGAGTDCEVSRSYLTLVASERGFIDRALATEPRNWGGLRDDPPSARVRAAHRRVGRSGFISVRINDDRSRRSRIAIVFYAGDGEQAAQAYRTVPTNRWVRLGLGTRTRRATGTFCVQATDSKRKQSNTACARDVVR